MRLVLLADTHGLHRRVAVPDGDIVLHAGDLSGAGRPEELADFFGWFANLAHPHKVCIAGNHDWLAERDPAAFRALVPSQVTYLENEEAVVGGLRIWGSPITPWFLDWAFNRARGSEIDAYWRKLPERLDVLLVHGPPAGILDRTLEGLHVGCEDLARRIAEARPRLVVFGHIHEAAGRLERDGVRYVNASVLDAGYRVVRPPVTCTIEVAALRNDET